MAAIDLLNPRIIAEHRRTRGVLGGEFAGLPVLLLTTRGWRTGRPHATPLGYVTDGESLVVAASAGGSAAHPDWYRNLRINGRAVVEVGSQRLVAKAAVLTGGQRQQLFERLCLTLPGMSEYAAAAGREIPVVALTPMSAKARPAADADRFRSLHRRGDPLVLVNVWDAVTATRVAAVGGRAVATSSAAVAPSLGLPDDPSVPLDPFFDAVARISDAVTVPVSADVLDGFGLDPVELVDRLVAAGAVGCNLEDSDHSRPGTQVRPEDFAARVASVRAAATAVGVDLVINARIDSYLHLGADATDDVLARAPLYLEAGADCVYPVRLINPRTVRELVRRLDAPVNANVASSAQVAAIAEAGASRISVGPMAFHTTLAAFDTLAAELIGTQGGESR